MVNPNEPSGPNPSDDDLPPDPFGPGDPFVVDPIVDPSGSSPDARPGQPAPGDPFGGLLGGAFGGLLGPMLGNFAQAMAKQGPLPWDTVTQLATYAATTVDGVSRPGTIDPLHRIRLEELVRIAELHVVEVGGLTLAGIDGVKVQAVTREAWANQFLTQQRTLFERLAGALATPPPGDPTEVVDESDEMIAGLMKMIGPSLLAMQLGAMAGQLAQRGFGNADLPLPSPPNGDRVTFITENIATFATEWSLPLDSLQMRLVIEELVMHAVMRLPHIQDLFSELTNRHAAAVRVDMGALSERLSNIQDPSQMQEQLSGAGALGVTQTPELQRAAHDVTRLVTLVEGWCDHVAHQVAQRLLGGDRRAEEALRRRRLGSDAGTDLLASLVGVRLDQAMFDRGTAFIAGVFERAGSDGLLQLWESRDHLPTDNELDAPGLWLARLELDQ